MTPQSQPGIFTVQGARCIIVPVAASPRVSAAGKPAEQRAVAARLPEEFLDDHSVHLSPITSSARDSGQNRP